MRDIANETEQEKDERDHSEAVTKYTSPEDDDPKNNEDPGNNENATHGRNKANGGESKEKAPTEDFFIDRIIEHRMNPRRRHRYAKEGEPLYRDLSYGF